MKNFILLFCILFMSCDDLSDCCINIDITTNNGNDLLNPNTINAIDFGKIKIFYVINGNEKEIYYPNYDTPKGISLSEPEDSNHDTFCLRLSLNVESEEEITTTIIQWPDNSRDSINAAFKRTDNTTICTKLWLNGVLVWDRGRRFFEIIK